MGLVDLMSAEPVSLSGRPLRVENSRSTVSKGGSSAGNLRHVTDDNDAYISQVIMQDQERQEKQEASEMRRLGVELREVSPALAQHADVRSITIDHKQFFLAGVPPRCGSPRSDRRSTTKRKHV